MQRKFRLANGLNAKLHWLTDQKMREIAKACVEAWVFKTLIDCYAAITVNVGNETIHLVGLSHKQDEATAKEIVSFWQKEEKAINFARFAVYNGKCYDLNDQKGKFLLVAITRKISPRILLLLETTKNDA